MYWIMFSLITIITLFFALGCVMTIKEDGNGTPFFFVTVICGLLIWAFIENKTYETGKPTDIPINKVSVMKDKEVVIIRYNSYMETFNTKKEYDAISDSSFVLQETTEYNIQGEENGKKYNLVIK